MIVVSDTSPILNLARIRHLDLLPSLYAQVLIPPAVHRELMRSQDETRDFVDRALLYWLLPTHPNDKGLVAELRRTLDAGESEAIALALERKATLLLIDERLGRSVAKTFGVPITGLVGVLVEAKHRGLIEKVKPVHDDLRSKARFWMTEELYNEVLIATAEN